jgi:hypothetical protein
MTARPSMARASMARGSSPGRPLRGLFAALAALLLSHSTAASLQAQRAPPPLSPAAAVDAMGEVPARAAVREILDGAPARGIPVEPLLTKVREGIAKRSDPSGYAMP